MANPSVDAARRFDTLPSIFQRYRSPLRAALRRSLASDTLPVYRMLRYSMGWNDADGKPINATEGKALRPTLCLFGCEATGGTIERGMPAAVALELIHHFSLIHDDIQDRDETRHHRPTLWAMWGIPVALVAGNTMRVVADRTLWQLVGNGVPHRAALQVAALLTEAYLQMIEGQYLDLAYEGQPDISLDDYLGMISRKTGALIRCSLHVGAVLGAQDDTTAAAFRECGRSLGYVFQIRDDVLGIWGDEKLTGKPVGADIRRKKNSLPIVYAMSRARGAEKEELMRIYKKESPDSSDVDSVLGIMARLKTQEYAQSLAAENCERALGHIRDVALAPGFDSDINEVARFLLVRER
ncbi:MAG: polyprenyl synthetase family protein [SAR202 cluster bacterium]|nr:polyprenyl synthetase family protein [SAR202 cluster bacterium]